MARKIKIPNHILKRRLRKEKKRKEEIKEKRKFYLIVCEGEKTEPNYFKSLKENLPQGVLNVCEFKILGTGNNTNSLVKKAMDLRKKWEEDTSRIIDKLWVVFDKDSFTSQSFNSAIQTCIANKPLVDAAWSNEAFELWYLLHFHFYNTAISRSQYKKLIEENLKEKGLSDFKYEKNSPEMYEILSKYGNINDAKRNAERLEKDNDGTFDFANHNPCTKVHHLVFELLNLDRTLNEEEE